MENGELKKENAGGMGVTRALPIIFRYPFLIFNSREARDGFPEKEPPAKIKKYQSAKRMVMYL
jgi:hypothetical protein